MYQYQKKLDGSIREDIILRVSDDPKVIISIPCDESNRDYIEYKEWLSKGNKPKDAD
mgnify:CR=1 FL=1|tara:strand:- start:349 stop:519 length:171 start_codon:yes stop_codon:yes gene_type:complete